MRYIDLFAGIGGFHYGIEKATTAECVYSNEWDKYANSVYRKHFGECDQTDITKVNATDIPDHDLLCGGFPCQSFSIAGKRGGFNDTRGTLFFDIARILKEKHPRLCLLENVKGLLSHDNGRTIKTIFATLTELGYDIQWQVCNSKDFGVPQNRERVFIVGHLRGTPRPKVFLIGEYGAKDNGVQRHISNTLTARYEEAQATGTYIGESKQYAQESGRQSVQQKGDKPDYSDSRRGQPHTADIAIPVLTPDRLTKRQNGRRMKTDGEPSFTLTGQDIHGVSDGMRIRRLTPVECERLQGFPEVENYVIIQVCRQADVNGAGKTLNIKDIDQDNVVHPDVLINLGENGVEIHSHGKLLLNAKNVEKKNWYHPLIKIEDFAQMIAGINTILEKITINGKGESHQSERCLIPQKNGKTLVRLYGNEIMQLAGDVEKDSTTLNKLLKPIILDHLDTKALEQRLTTLSLFVAHVISGYIPKEIQNQNTYTIEIHHRYGWTQYGADGELISDTQRYKMAGNAVTTNVITEIAKQLI